MASKEFGKPIANGLVNYAKKTEKNWLNGQPLSKPPQHPCSKLQRQFSSSSNSSSLSTQSTGL
jgi:hypothetical protein